MEIPKKSAPCWQDHKADVPCFGMKVAVSIGMVGLKPWPFAELDCPPLRPPHIAIHLAFAFFWQQIVATGIAFFLSTIAIWPYLNAKHPSRFFAPSWARWQATPLALLKKLADPSLGLQKLHAARFRLPGRSPD